jgi:hypothetical protein
LIVQPLLIVDWGLEIYRQIQQQTNNRRATLINESLIKDRQITNGLVLSRVQATLSERFGVDWSGRGCRRVQIACNARG